jgi:NTE family protein
MADRVLLLASASASPEADPVEARYLSGEERLSGAEQVLVLLHDDERRIPEGTAGWLERRPAGAVAGHVHVRSNSERDLTRLMRLQSARATGLVLCGGGARCFAHLGVYRALQEQGIRIDRVGGSGLGAVMGALIALDAPAEELIAYVREAFQVNPTGDISWLPLTALVRGKRLKAMLDEAIEHVGAAGARIEDTWIDFFCVASNYSKAYEVVLRRGDLSRSLRASCAVPGLLPPVPIAGDLMVDGGAFNSYPTDVMARSGVARIIGVNIARDANPEFSLDEIPGSLALAWDKVTGSRRKYRVPSLMSIMMNAMTLNSAAREQGADSMADLEFRINLPSVGVFDWHAFEHAVDVGYRHAGKVLREMPAHELAAFRN